VAGYVTTEFGAALGRLTRQDRREIVLLLNQTGLSTRAIAPIVGVTHETVAQDLKPPVRNLTPADEAVSSPLEATDVVGIDGRTYSRTERKPRPRPPLERLYRDAAYDLGARVRRLEKLHKDPRFRSNVVALEPYRRDLSRVRDQLDALLRDFQLDTGKRVVS
jgi:hypothetical protein